MIALAVVSQAVVAYAPRPLPIAKRFLRHGHRFIVCAHRGDHTMAPENSLDAYERAAKEGADYGEADLRMTKDGVIVLMHDATVDRTTDGHGAVANMTFAEIRALHFKNAQRPDEKVPTFEELLDVVRGKMGIYMDIKAVHAKDVLPLLKKHRMEKDVIAYLYGPTHRREWIADAPEIPIISDNRMRSTDQIETDWKPTPFAITDGPSREYTPEFVQKFHDLGVAVVPDIQGSDEAPTKWDPMLDMGVDGLQTDHPGDLIAYLKSKKIR
jgi:glycerophosphoryl diester phosphodiesterase